MGFVRGAFHAYIFKLITDTHALDTSTAGFILIMSNFCHSIREQVDSQVVNDSWRKCEEILAFMAIFSLSARNSLRFLQITHQHIVQNYSGSWLSNTECGGFISNSRVATFRPGDTTPLTPAQLHQRGNQQMNRPEVSSQSAEPVSDAHNLRHEPNSLDNNPFTTWDEMGLGQEEFGFLGRFDLPDIASWFTDIPP